MLSEKADGKMAKAGLMPKSNKQYRAEFKVRQKELGRSARELFLTDFEKQKVNELILKMSIVSFVCNINLYPRAPEFGKQIPLLCAFDFRFDRSAVIPAKSKAGTGNSLPPANTSSAILTAENIENLKNKITNRRNDYKGEGRFLTKCNT